MKLTINALAIAILLLCTPGATLADDSTIFDLDIEQLLEVTVTTASKEAESVERATAVMRVVTRAEIERSGVRTLSELLKRVPGFFPSNQATWNVTGSRGVFADSNDHILLLIDGHRQNSIVGQGYQQQDSFPLLDKVERVEIIRGPGSVLWGSSAVQGIINIITRGSLEAATTEVNANYRNEDGLFSANAMQSFSQELVGGGSIAGIVSLSYWTSEGYERNGRSAGVEAFSQADAANAISNVEFPWGVLGNWPSLDTQYDNFEVYSKISLGAEQEILARFLDASVVYPWDSITPGTESDLRTRKMYLEYRRSKEFSSNTSTEISVYGDLLLQNRFPIGGINRAAPPERVQDQSNEESALGAEAAVSHRWSEGHRLKAGVQYVRTEIGPNRDTSFIVSTNTPVAEDANGDPLPYVGVDSGTDNNVAGYLEDHISFNDGATSLFAGLRIDNNDYRESKAVVLPRGGIIQSIGDSVTAKYIVNTGYLRPNAVYSKTQGVIVDETRTDGAEEILRVTESEEVLSHDLWLSWSDEVDFFAVGLFYSTISDFISFDAINLPQGYKNLGDVTTYGLEIEGRKKLSELLSVYANYSFNRAESDSDEAKGGLSNDNDRLLNYPSHISNIGLDISLEERVTLNANLYLWRDMKVIKSIRETDSFGEFARIDGEEYLDVTLVLLSPFGLPARLNIYANNILDNDERVGLVTNGGYYYPIGRNIGAGITYRF